MEGLCETSRAAAVSMRQQFEAVRSNREGLFLKSFNHIAKAIDDIYKDLTQVGVRVGVRVRVRVLGLGVGLGVGLGLGLGLPHLQGPHAGRGGWGG